MSPLLDVTNRVRQECGPQQPPPPTSAQPTLCAARDQGKPSRRVLSKKLKEKTETVAINMCNTPTAGLGGGCGDGEPAHLQVQPHRHRTSVSSTHTTDILLSQAVQTLSLGHTARWPHSHARRRTHKENVAVEASRGKTVAHDGGLPEVPGGGWVEGAPQQCGACGLQFTSVPGLTQHLARHVYDGLYAAQWLTQAMNLVLSRGPTTTTHQPPARHSQ